VSATVCLTLFFYDYVGESHRGLLPIMARNLNLTLRLWQVADNNRVDAVTLTIYFTIATWLLDI